MRRLAAILLLAGLAAGCGGGDDAGTPSPDTPSQAAPQIGTDMVMPVDDPFCTFSAEGADTEGSYVFVTALGDSVYHGYASLDGDTVRLTEIEAGFGSGIETRRYVNEDESVELEVILLEAGETDTAIAYTGSVRPIFPVEGEAVKFVGECAAGAADGD